MSLSLFIGFISFTLFGQVGHIMQGIGSVNMSMGGAATGQPIDINGPLQWNPAGISVFNEKIFSVNAGLFYSAPILSSTAPSPQGPISGTTEDERGVTVLPSIAMTFGKEESKHTFGISAFGVSGFGVNFPENLANPINAPQNLGGFGLIKSDYLLMQISFAYAYELAEGLSIGIAPDINYALLELIPNPLSSPSPKLGYPISDKAGSIGIGGQIGILYETPIGFKIGASYKTTKFFGEFDLENTYLDGSSAPKNAFNLDFPAIISFGIGYSNEAFDLAFDYRLVNYENTDGFEKGGWTPMASVAGFGWEDMSVISAGIQYKGINKLPLRIGYTNSGVPIPEDLVFISIPATAVIQNAFEVGIGFIVNDRFTINLNYHYGTSSGATKGPLLSPLVITDSNPFGKVPDSEVTYEMKTNMIMIGIQSTFAR